jgi:hypothetical protein
LTRNSRKPGRQCETGQERLLIWSAVATVVALIASTAGIVSQLTDRLPIIVQGDDGR